jgi:spore germination protein GerM
MGVRTASNRRSKLLAMAEQHSRSIPLNVVVALSSVAVLAGGATAWWTLRTPRPVDRNPSTISQPVTPPSTANGVLNPGTDGTQAGEATPDNQPSPTATEQSVSVYWLDARSGQIQLAPQPATLNAAAASPQEALTSGVEQLLAGPQESAYTTTIPQGTQLRSLTLEADGIYVDLSQEFTAGGGSAAMQGRVAQILYTVTSQDPSANVWLSVEGERLEVLGGEGLVLDQPLTRQSFNQNFTL